MSETERKTTDEQAITPLEPEQQRELDRELVEKALQGDRDARTTIVLEHQRNVYNLALRITGSSEAAESVLQDTFLKVFEKLDAFRGDSQLGTWIHRIAVNAALMQMRAKKGKYYVPIEEEPRDEDDNGNLAYVVRSLDRDPLELTLNEELKQRLDEAISGLPDSLRTAFVLKDLEGLSMAEIADEVGKSVSAVKADLHRARLRLRAKLAEFVQGGSDGHI